jgi:hypothetical protein
MRTEQVKSKLPNSSFQKERKLIVSEDALKDLRELQSKLVLGTKMVKPKAERSD